MQQNYAYPQKNVKNGSLNFVGEPSRTITGVSNLLIIIKKAAKKRPEARKLSTEIAQYIHRKGLFYRLPAKAEKRIK